jgi:hypothetical protein
VCFHDLRKWKDAVYTRLEVVRLDVIENILLSLFRYSDRSTAKMTGDGGIRLALALFFLE